MLGDVVKHNCTEFISHPHSYSKIDVKITLPCIPSLRKDIVLLLAPQTLKKSMFRCYVILILVSYLWKINLYWVLFTRREFWPRSIMRTSKLSALKDKASITLASLSEVYVFFHSSKFGVTNSNSARGICMCVFYELSARSIISKVNSGLEDPRGPNP